MAWIFNPFTGRLDYYERGSGTPYNVQGHVASADSSVRVTNSGPENIDLHVDPAVIPDNTISVNKLNATGTRSSSTVLSGANTFVSLPSTVTQVRLTSVAVLFNDTPTKLLFNLSARYTMLRITAIIEQPFNSASPVLTIGDATNQTKYADADDIILTDPAGDVSKVSCIARSSTSTTPVNGYLNANGATVGQIRLLFEYVVG